MASAHPSRRVFLKVLAQGGALVSAVSAGIGCGNGGPTGMIPAGNVKDLPMSTLQAVPSEALAIGRDERGVYAMTLICTHEGCDMANQGQVSADGIVCTCHGSRFDADGNVLSGPARSSLEHFTVILGAAGDITVNADVTVDAATRVAVA
jgi:Rieske Fe-S protein